MIGSFRGVAASSPLRCSLRGLGGARKRLRRGRWPGRGRAAAGSRGRPVRSPPQDRGGPSPPPRLGSGSPRGPGPRWGAARAARMSRLDLRSRRGGAPAPTRSWAPGPGSLPSPAPAPLSPVRRRLPRGRPRPARGLPRRGPWRRRAQSPAGAMQRAGRGQRPRSQPGRGRARAAWGGKEGAGAPWGKAEGWW